MNIIPATDKQIAFIRNLLAERQGMPDAEPIRARLNLARTQGLLSKTVASDAITALLAIPRPRPTQAAPVASTQAASAPVAPVLRDGFYGRVEDDALVIYKVQIAVHGSGNLYAKRLTLVDGKGRWEYAPGIVRQLTEADELTMEQAAEFGHLYGVCGICGAVLTDEDSIERGIGPVCAKRFG